VFLHNVGCFRTTERYGLKDYTIHYRVSTSLPRVHIVSQMYPVHRWILLKFVFSKFIVSWRQIKQDSESLRPRCPCATSRSSVAVIATRAALSCFQYVWHMKEPGTIPKQQRPVYRTCFIIEEPRPQISRTTVLWLIWSRWWIELALDRVHG
jgi:hypothetical protein